MRHLFIGLAFFCVAAPAAIAQSKNSPVDKFRQLEELLPTPNDYRTASGAPGHKYWQQRADYVIDVELDDANQRIIASETVTYFNNSPDTRTGRRKIFQEKNMANPMQEAEGKTKMP